MHEDRGFQFGADTAGHDDVSANYGATNQFFGRRAGGAEPRHQSGELEANNNMAVNEING